MNLCTRLNLVRYLLDAGHAHVASCRFHDFVSRAVWHDEARNAVTIRYEPVYRIGPVTLLCVYSTEECFEYISATYPEWIFPTLIN